MVRTRSKSPAPRRRKPPAKSKPAPALAPAPAPAPRKQWRMSTMYAVAVLGVAVGNALTIDIYSRACGMNTWSPMNLVRVMASAGSPLCNALATITGGLGSAYSQVWTHAAGVVVMRVGELFAYY